MHINGYHYSNGFSSESGHCNTQDEYEALRYFLSVFPGTPFLGGPKDTHRRRTFLQLETEILQDGGGGGEELLFIGRLEPPGLQSTMPGAFRSQLEEALRAGYLSTA